MIYTSVFDHFVVTTPSSRIAAQYRQQFHRLTSKHPEILGNTVIHCVSDPESKRVGSGGGTLNVVDYLIYEIGVEAVKAAKVLVFHSGGESKRSPLHSVCGKGWASINATMQDCDLISNPMLLLFMEITSLLKDVPIGSLVVACCDVLLDLYRVCEIYSIVMISLRIFGV
jgi:hypothetical protein